MAASDLINLSGLIDDAKCFALVTLLHGPGVHPVRLTME